MKIVLLAFCAAAALSGCATDGSGYGGGGRYYGGGDVTFYNSAYGRYYDGYWDNNIYYYRTSPRGVYLRDDARNFRRDRADGYREYRGQRGRQWREIRRR